MGENEFERFIKAEIDEIKRSIDEEALNDPLLCECLVERWIESKAAAFRMKWNATHNN